MLQQISLFQTNLFYREIGFVTLIYINFEYFLYNNRKSHLETKNCLSLKIQSTVGF